MQRTDFHCLFRRIAFRGVLLAGYAVPAIVNATIGNTKPDPYVNISVMQGQQHVELFVSAHDPKGLKSIEVFLNGKALDRHPKRDLRIRPRDIEDLKNLQGVRVYSPRLKVPVRALKDGENSIVVHAKNMQGRKRTKQTTFSYKRPKGTIYLASIGINAYRQPNVPALKYAENDARAVAKYFREQVGVPKANIFTLIGKQATERNIRRLLGVTLKRKAGRNDQIVIFYAGHGVPEFDSRPDVPDQVEKYLLPWDGETDALIATSIPMSLIGKLSNLYVSERVVFLLDTCFSGAAATRNARTRTLAGALGGRRSVRLDDGFLNKVAKGRGKVILTASGINEASQELDSLRHGVFTYYLLEGMKKGGADFDGDGAVSVSEIHKYLGERVPPRTNQEQQPAYFVNSQVTGEIVLGKSPFAALKLDAPDPWSVAGDSGRLVLQVVPSAADIYIDGNHHRGFINTLLEPGRYRLQIEKDGYKPYVGDIRINRHRLVNLKIPLEKSRDNGNSRRNRVKRSYPNWRPPPPP